jgi:hypothetical protein
MRPTAASVSPRANGRFPNLLLKGGFGEQRQGGNGSTAGSQNEAGYRALDDRRGASSSLPVDDDEDQATWLRMKDANGATAFRSSTWPAQAQPAP